MQLVANIEAGSAGTLTFHWRQCTSPTIRLAAGASVTSAGAGYHGSALPELIVRVLAWRTRKQSHCSRRIRFIRFEWRMTSSSAHGGFSRPYIEGRCIFEVNIRAERPGKKRRRFRESNGGRLTSVRGYSKCCVDVQGLSGCRRYCRYYRGGDALVFVAVNLLA